MARYHAVTLGLGLGITKRVGAIVAGLSAAALSATAQAPRSLTITRDLKIDAATHDLSAGIQLDIGRDGTIVVTQPQDSKVLFFNPAGAKIATLGRPGEGPGEFRSVGNHGRYGDSLWVLDFQVHRISLVSPQGKYLRTMPWPPVLLLSPTDSVGLPTLGGVTPRGYAPGGGIVADLTVARTAVRPPWYAADETRRPIVVTSQAGVLQKVIGWAPQSNPPECQATYATSTGEGGVRIPYCAAALTSFSRDGRRIAIVSQQNARSATGEYVLVVIDTKGDTVISRKYRYAPVPVSKHAGDSAIASLLAQHIPGRGPTPQYIAAVRSLKHPQNYAPVRRLHIGLDDTIWLEIEAGASGHHWEVLSPTGDVVGQVALPASVTLAAETRTVVWGVERDRDDLENVVRYKVGPE